MRHLIILAALAVSVGAAWGQTTPGGKNGQVTIHCPGMTLTYIPSTADKGDPCEQYAIGRGALQAQIKASRPSATPDELKAAAESRMAPVYTLAEIDRMRKTIADRLAYEHRDIIAPCFGYAACPSYNLLPESLRLGVETELQAQIAAGISPEALERAACPAP